MVKQVKLNNTRIKYNNFLVISYTLSIFILFTISNYGFTYLLSRIIDYIKSGISFKKSHNKQHFSIFIKIEFHDWENQILRSMSKLFLFSIENGDVDPCVAIHG